jgi:hypothetical protein
MQGKHVNIKQCLAASSDMSIRIFEVAEEIAGGGLAGELLIEALICGSRHKKVVALARAVQPIIQAKEDLDFAIAMHTEAAKRGQS